LRHDRRPILRLSRRPPYLGWETKRGVELPIPGDKVSGEARERLDAAVERAKKALKQDELGELNAARDELMQAFSAAGQQFYQAQAAEQAPPEGAEPGAEAPGAEAGATAGAAGGAEEDVVEADYEIVDEEK